VLSGGPGDDKLIAEAGDDRLIDGPGKDNLFGGAGRDVFLLVNDDDPDSVKDFDPAEDLIDLTAWGVTAFSDLVVAAHPSGKSIISYGAHSLAVGDPAHQLSPGDLGADSFLFAPEILQTGTDSAAPLAWDTIGGS